MSQLSEVNDLSQDHFLRANNLRLRAEEYTSGEIKLGVTKEDIDPKPESKAKRFGAAMLDVLIEGMEAKSTTAGSFKMMLIETAVKLLIKAILVAIRAVFK